MTQQHPITPLPELIKDWHDAEEALNELNLTSDCMGAIVSCAQVKLIRRALERLQELEGGNG